MKKIGIVTITDGDNYGNRLPNYALQTVLGKFDFEIETLKNNSAKDKFGKKHKIMFFIKKIIKFILYPKREYTKICRKKIFEEFNKKYIFFSKYSVSNQLDKINKNINEEYEYFCCGSDQIWNPEYKENAEANFLQFACREKRFAYAPSIAVQNIPESRKAEYKKYLNEIDSLSIREDEGARIIKELTGKDVPVLLDPTMLLTEEEWNKVLKKPKQLKNNKYILNYFLGTLSETRKKEIERVAKENNCEIINILDVNSPFYKTGPSEFLYLEKNAFLICTDSFHSAVFAILYNKPFIVFNREDKTVNMNSRIETLINKFKLKNRKFENRILEENLKHDYKEAYDVLNVEKEKAKKFLEKILI